MKGLSDRQKLGAVLLIHAAVSAIVFRYGTALQDEGLLYAWGRRLLDGQRPYTDFYLVQAPGTFYVQALLIKLFGVSFLAGRIFKQIQGLVAVWLSYHVVLRASRDARSALAGAIATATFSAAHHYRFPWYSTDACILLLIAFWCAVTWLDLRRERWVLAAGAALGAATLFKQNHGLFGAAVVGFVLCWDAWGAAPPSSAVRRCFAAARVGGTLFAGFAASIGSYLAAYVSQGGSLRLLWLNCFVWASEAKDFGSAWEVLSYPLKVFALVHKSNWVYPAAAAVFLCGVATALHARAPRWIRALGAVAAASTVALGAEVAVRVYVWSFGSALVFATAAAAAIEAVATPLASTKAPRARASALVALAAAANLYAGTIPGGGWGRLVETLPGTLLGIGIAAYLLTGHGGVIAGWWSRNVWLSAPAVGRALAAVSLAVSAALLFKNQAFRPKLDVELRAMTATATSTGWRGLVGDPLYVRETDALLTEMRGLPEERRKTLYVFPLNAAIYALAGIPNPTRFDSQQVDFLAPSRFGEVASDLEVTLPALVVLQRRANASSAPDADDLDTWVRPRLRAMVEDFVHRHYELAHQWNYYELWTIRPAARS